VPPFWITDSPPKPRVLLYEDLRIISGIYRQRTENFDAEVLSGELVRCAARSDKLNENNGV